MMVRGNTIPDSPRKRLLSIFGGSAGNLVEWFDWYVYSTFALYFAHHFFPSTDRTAQLLGTGAVFAVGFLMRPVGAWLMGIYCDRQGRKAGLTLSVLLMSAGAMMIALTPDYAAIGVAAPAILVAARLLQGLSVGGEYGASATYLSEIAHSQMRGFWSSFQYVTLIMGQLLALATLIIMQHLIGEQAVSDWGWRVAFGISAVLALVVLFIRRHLIETEVFARNQTRRSPPSSIRRLIGAHLGSVLLVIMLTAGGTLAFYTYSTYMQKYLVNTVGYSTAMANWIMAAALFIFMLVQPAFGALSDRIGRKPLMVTFGVLGMVATVPIFAALPQVTDPRGGFLLVVTALLIVSGYTSINAIVKAELFPVHIRALGVALPYAIANALFGGTAEYVALRLKQAGIEQVYPWYVTVMIGISLLVYLSMSEPLRNSLIDKD